MQSHVFVKFGADDIRDDGDDFVLYVPDCFHHDIPPKVCRIPKASLMLPPEFDRDKIILALPVDLVRKLGMEWVQFGTA